MRSRFPRGNRHAPETARHLLGALLAAIGFDATAFASNGGYSVSILAAGQGVFKTFGLLVNGTTALMFLAVMTVFAFVTVLGFAAGAVRYVLRR